MKKIENYKTNAVVVKCKKCKTKNYCAYIDLGNGGGNSIALTNYCVKCSVKLTDKNIDVLDNSPRIRRHRIKPAPTIPLFDVNDEKSYR